MIENVTPATPIMDPAMVESTARAPSGRLPNRNGTLSIQSGPTRPSTPTSTSESAAAATVISDGKNQ